MNRLSLIALAFATMTFGATAEATSITAPLTEAEVNALPPSARELYNEAVRALDFVRHQEAVDALVGAAERAPRAVALNLAAAEAAGRWAEIRHGDESHQYYRSALSLLDGIRHEEMTSVQRDRTESLTSRFREAADVVNVRDQERMSTGFRLVQTVRRERLQRAVRDSDEGARVLLGEERRSEERGDDFYEERAGEIWPQFAAPARYVPPRFRPDQMGGMGMGMGMGFDPGMMGQFGGDPAMMGMYGEAGMFGGGGDPFAAGGDPFAAGGDPFGGQGQGGFGGDPFGAQGRGQGGFGGDPFGGGGQQQFGDPTIQSPFIDQEGQ